MALYLVGISPDVTVKSSRTRRRFQTRLVRNIRDALAETGRTGKVADRWGRLVLDTPDDLARERVASVFGVHSLLEIEARVPAELDRIVREGERIFGDRVRGRTYAVRARRVGKYPFRSRDIEVQLGAALNTHGTVDLTQPDVTVRVEVRDGEAFLFARRYDGVGGLPLGVEGRAVALLSGGFDSPVAAWMMLRRGVALDYVFCNLGGEAYERSVLSVAKVLADSWSYGDRPKIHVVDFARPLDDLRRAVEERYWQVVLKRLMYRTAAAVARATRGLAIVTGEAMGQVSSQTLANLRAIEEGCPLPLLRPVLGMDKQEIIDRARTIGTAVLSAQIREFCRLGQARPVTSAAPPAVQAREALLDHAILDDAIAARRVLDLRGLASADLVAPYLFTDTVPVGAVVIDCRDARQYRLWHYPGAERRDATDLAARFRVLDKERTYVLYCGVGIQSAHVAEMMQQAGYDAYSFKGGLRQLQRVVQTTDPQGAAAGR